MRWTGRRMRVFTPIFCTVFLSDCASKRVAVASLSPPHVPHDVLGDVLRFTLAYNDKAAMGLHVGAQSRWILTAIAITMLTGVAIWLRRTTTRSSLTLAAAALVAGGALGNLVDRLRWDRGVVDFIDVGLGSARFFIFNVADVAVLLGAVLLSYAMEQKARRTRCNDSPHTS